MFVSDTVQPLHFSSTVGASLNVLLQLKACAHILPLADNKNSTDTRLVLA